ncbi:MAG: M56 family metallopeptidase [Pseudomonadota bacterium]
MIETLMQAVLSNTGFALILALAAMFVGAKSRYPELTNLLWLLVFIKLVTPPLLNVLVEVGETEEVATSSSQAFIVPTAVNVSDFAPVIVTPAIDSSAFWQSPIFWIGAIWLLGSALIVLWSIRRTLQFHRLLIESSVPASPALQRMTARLAIKLDLNHRFPEICVSSARISPMVWWVGGRLRIVIPEALLKQMDDAACQWVIAHELAHIYRRDYLVRWLEWFTCAVFWWNPLVWWAQKGLRESEEVCCDALVLNKLHPRPHTYANSLLNAVEFLAISAHRPPKLASAINHGGSLERRFKMILSSHSLHTTPHWVRNLVLLCAAILLPLGVVNGHDVDTDHDVKINVKVKADKSGEYAAMESRIKKAVEVGSLTEQDAEILLGAMRKQIASEKDVVISDNEIYPHIKKSIDAAVTAGKLSKEEAAEHIHEIHKEIKIELEDINIGEIVREALETAQEAQTEAQEHLAEIRIELAEKLSDIDVNKIVQDAMSAAKSAKADAQKHVIVLRKELADIEFDLRNNKELHQSLKEAIDYAVEAGELTEQEAQEKLKKLRKFFSGDHHAKAE